MSVFDHDRLALCNIFT